MFFSSISSAFAADEEEKDLPEMRCVLESGCAEALESSFSESSPKASSVLSHAEEEVTLTLSPKEKLRDLEKFYAADNPDFDGNSSFLKLNG